jgi:hypothetical protein
LAGGERIREVVKVDGVGLAELRVSGGDGEQTRTECAFHLGGVM